MSIHGLGPHGPARAPMFTDKASPAGPRHTHTVRGAMEGERHRGGREKGNKGRENGEGQGKPSVWQHPLSPNSAGVTGCH